MKVPPKSRIISLAVLILAVTFIFGVGSFTFFYLTNSAPEKSYFANTATSIRWGDNEQKIKFFSVAYDEVEPTINAWLESTENVVVDDITVTAYGTDWGVALYYHLLGGKKSATRVKYIGGSEIYPTGIATTTDVREVLEDRVQGFLDSFSQDHTILSTQILSGNGPWEVLIVYTTQSRTEKEDNTKSDTKSKKDTVSSLIAAESGSGFDGSVVDTSAAASTESSSEGLSVTPIGGMDVGVIVETSTTMTTETTTATETTTETTSEASTGETTTEITAETTSEAPPTSADPNSAGGSVEVIPEELFDIRLSLEKNQLARLQDLAAVVTFDSFGSIPTPVSMLFFVTDDKGLLIWQGSTFENITVETSRVYRRLFAETGKELPPGTYELYLRTSYGEGVVDGFSAPFEIGEPMPSPWRLPLYAGLGILGVIATGLLAWTAHYILHHHVLFHHRLARRSTARSAKPASAKGSGAARKE